MEGCLSSTVFFSFSSVTLARERLGVFVDFKAMVPVVFRRCIPFSVMIKEPLCH